MPQVRIYGLREFRAAVGRLDAEMPDIADDAAHDAAERVADSARKQIPLGPGRNGHARNSVKVVKKGDGWSVQSGGQRFPYYPWLDFGGTINRHTSKPTHRAFFKSGRYIYPAYERNKSTINNIMERALESGARGTGLDVE